MTEETLYRIPRVTLSGKLEDSEPERTSEIGHMSTDTLRVRDKIGVIKKGGHFKSQKKIGRYRYGILHLVKCLLI